MHATQELTDSSPKKHSVQFKAEESDKPQLFSSVYLNREAAKKQLGVKNLDDVKGIEITVRIIK